MLKGGRERGRARRDGGREERREKRESEEGDKEGEGKVDRKIILSALVIHYSGGKIFIFITVVFIYSCVHFLFQITSLLSFDAFLDVISQLVVLASKEGVAGSESIQEKALEMLRVKLEKTKISNPHVRFCLYCSGPLLAFLLLIIFV